MKQTFIKYLFSFQLGVNCIGLPIFYEVHTITKISNSIYGKQSINKVFLSNMI